MTIQEKIPFKEIKEQCPALNCKDAPDPRPPMVHWVGSYDDGDYEGEVRSVVYSIFRPCVKHYDIYLNASDIFRPLGEPPPSSMIPCA